jgi:hypothetical protein
VLDENLASNVEPIAAVPQRSVLLVLDAPTTVVRASAVELRLSKRPAFQTYARIINPIVMRNSLRLRIAGIDVCRLCAELPRVVAAVNRLKFKVAASQ